MITLFSAGARRSDLRRQAQIRRHQLRRRLHRIRHEVRCAIRTQREEAIISYLSARWFPLKSKEALILRLLAQTAMHRVKKLETMLSHLSDTTRPQPRRWLFDWRYLYVSYAPRYWLLRWHKYHKD